MLLASLEGKNEAPSSLSINALSHNPSRQLAYIVLAACHETDRRASIAKRKSEALSVADSNVEAPFSRGANNCKGRRVAVAYRNGSGCMGSLSKTVQVFNDSESVYGRDDDTGNVSALKSFCKCLWACLSVFLGNHARLDSVIAGISPDNFTHLRQQSLGEQDLRFAFGA